MPSNAVRTRFAPSPTGFLHVGSARTALFSWAYARRHAGRFVLRIEDTDRERSTRESEAAVLEGLEWLGIDWDEGPFRQSERAERHAEVVEELLAHDRAYRCRCTAAEIDERRQATIAGGGKWTYDGRCRELALGPDCGPHTVRLRLPASGLLGWSDGVFGESGQDAREIGDVIIRRSDGAPLYNLAVVVDDLDMGVTHVIRGADHHANTPLQIALYRALDRNPPHFAHVPLIVGAGGKKLSKRRDPVSVQNFRDEGYLPEALCNWLMRIGWSHGDQEIFSRAEMAALFDLEHVSRSSAQADLAKLQWLNQHYLKQLATSDLRAELAPFAQREIGSAVALDASLDPLLDALRERSHTLSDFAKRARFAIAETIEIEPAAAAKHLNAASAPLLRELQREIESLGAFTPAALEAAFERVRERNAGIGMGKLAQPVRVAITGGTASPGIFETLASVGRERCVARLGAALAIAERSATAGH
jgi:glutamyl-tRNA synthetase